LRASTDRGRLFALQALGGALLLLQTSLARAFPPYRDTDAETTPTWELEGRLGLVHFAREDGENAYASPLVRLNLGLPQNLELTGELEYVPADGRLGDAATGGKWIPYFHELSLGIEVLALLPVSSEGGAGVESSLLATQRWQAFRLHLNAGGFYDARPAPTEKGWKAGALGELEVGRFRPGLELFMKHVIAEPVAVQAGAGVIVSFGRLDLRAGTHVGLTEAAPEITASLWIGGTLPLAEPDGETPPPKTEARLASEKKCPWRGERRVVGLEQALRTGENHE
jgi:hypothetical protein